MKSFDFQKDVLLISQAVVWLYNCVLEGVLQCARSGLLAALTADSVDLFLPKHRVYR